MERGEIWWASLPDPRGSEPGYRRPVVIAQSDEFTRSRIGTVLVVAITSNRRLADAPGNFLVRRKGTGLSRDSVVNVSQVLTLDKRFLAERCGGLGARQMELLDQGLRLVLSL